MEADGNGTLEWPDPDLDFWPMSELSALNLSWLDQAELHGNSDASETLDRMMPGDKAKATSRGGQKVAARVSLSARLGQKDPTMVRPFICGSEKRKIGELRSRLPMQRGRQAVADFKVRESSS